MAVNEPKNWAGARDHCKRLHNGDLVVTISRDDLGISNSTQTLRADTPLLILMLLLNSTTLLILIDNC